MPADIFDARGEKVGATPNPTTTPTSPQSAGVHASDAWEQGQRRNAEAEREQAAQDEQQAALQAQVWRQMWATGSSFMRPMPVILGLGALGLFLGWAFTPRCSK